MELKLVAVELRRHTKKMFTINMERQAQLKIFHCLSDLYQEIRKDKWKNFWIQKLNILKFIQ